MNEHSPFNVDLLKIDNIQIVNAAINNNSGLAALEPNSYTYITQYSLEQGFNLEQKKIKTSFKTDIEINLKSGEKVDITASFNIAFFFSITNLEELATIIKEGELQVDSDLLLSISNIAYSTSRGIIFTRCQGTILNRIILPILSTKKLEDMLDLK